jgi:hypothetical protein
MIGALTADPQPYHLNYVLHYIYWSNECAISFICKVPKEEYDSDCKVLKVECGPDTKMPRVTWRPPRKNLREH